MKQLSRENAASFTFPPEIQAPDLTVRPVKVLQFGEGNFLRGFVDWMIDRMNRAGVFNGSVQIVQPISRGMVEELNEQGGIYTLFLRGLRKGSVIEQKEVIASVSGGINPYRDFDAFLRAAENPELRFVVSNTTEAGIAYTPEELPLNAPSASFPGKVVQLLYQRFSSFHGAADKGLVFLPCELIDRNGDNLKRIVLQLTREWTLPEDFRRWILEANVFCNTLVDRIVTGYPREQAVEYEGELGYRDKLLDTGELFHLWVIEGPAELKEEFPLQDADIRVVWTDDMTPYRTRKVRILNGAHTMTVPAAYLAGMETVGECLADNVVASFMKKGIFDEIMPVMEMPKKELKEYADEVLERFSNPFITHYLLDISLNSVSKFKARVLPSLKDYISRKKEVPGILSFSLAALIRFYRGSELKNGSLSGTRGGRTYRITDNQEVLEFFRGLWTEHAEGSKDLKAVAEAALAESRFWGEDLTGLKGLASAVAAHLENIQRAGMLAAIKDLL
ncbi:altronate oxidoreductase [Marispirochaeta aestuarii]|uniref:Altronate oxidoreductase n=1 Tax=Marispirochaeta aestuarii TaxID=1963862 RepID=A0A1Y1S0A9_9SPIO|nr:tagaturonate reductase [Marispirochaeta aestuarii]ORC35926.1 altronate oxidoreductase [Marispirochaeta aestuarii]